MKFIYLSYLLLELVHPFHQGDFVRAIKNSYYTLVRSEWWSLTDHWKPSKLDYKWQVKLKERGFVAHALGDYKRANEISSAMMSLEKGAKFLEVDLYLDNTKILRCHHGPEEPKPFKPKDCNFKKILTFVDNNNLFLILDIKNHFKETSKIIEKEILSRENPDKLSKLLIFQLMKPVDIETFTLLTNRSGLLWSAPIITLHRTHAYFDIVRKNIPKSINAITISWEKRNEIKPSKSLILMTHPINSCQAFAHSRKLGFDAAYGEASYLECQK